MTGGALIIGAGQAGVQLALSLRSLGHESKITVVGAESYQPYQRPPLSKAFLKDRSDPSTLALRSGAFYDREGVSILASSRIADISLSEGPPGRGGPRGVAHTDDGLALEFDQLALTTGARVRRLSVPGADLSGVCYLRDIDDAVRLKALLAEAQHVVVIGGGFIGLEAAAVARGQAKQVTVVEGADRLIPRAVAPVVSAFYRSAHERRGTQVRLQDEVIALTGTHGQVEEVHLADGTVLRADVVVVGIGIIPRTELAEGLGLTCDRGIVVDSYARTSNLGVVAAGDCTVLPNPLGGRELVRLESVQNAVDQAKCAAATMMGQPQPYTSVPWFWSDQADLKLQIAGLSAGFDESVVRGSPDSEKFSVLYYRQDRLIAIDAINRPQDYLAVRRALSSGQTMDSARVGDAAMPLKELAYTSGAV